MIKKVIEAARYAGRAFKAKYNEHGEELPDATPIEVPLGFKKPPTLHEQIAMFVRSEEWRRQAEAHGVENFEQANDFEVGDAEFDDIPTVHEMQEEFLKQAREDADEYVARAQEAVRKKREEEGATPPTPPAKKEPKSAPKKKDPEE